MSGRTRAAGAGTALLLAGLAACTAGQLPGTPATSPPPAAASGPQYPVVAPPAPQLYPVESVYDGDTLRVRFPDGRSESVRVLGVDTPEIKAVPNAPVPGSGAPEDLGRYPECGAEQARDAARALLQGKSVALTQDPAQPGEDRYGRLLRYVSLPDGRDLAAVLLEQGLAWVYTEYPVTRTPDYLALQTAARAAEQGGWSVCGWEN